MDEDNLENASLPYTERCNDLTKAIDVSDPIEMIGQLVRCDLEIFHGPAGSTDPILYSESVLESITRVTNKVIEFVTSEDPSNVAIIMTGSGTSGRIAFHISKNYNKIFKEHLGIKPFRYSISGDDLALLSSVEAPEDDPDAGVNALLRVSEGKSRVMVIGITCQLQSPYVVGQMKYCMEHRDRFVSVLMGFNPIHILRPLTPPNWTVNCKSVIERLEEMTYSNDGFIINPVYGGEAITGSSRMKGGSISKYILDTIMINSLEIAIEHNGEKFLDGAPCKFDNIKNTLQKYEAMAKKYYTFDSTFQTLEKLISICGTARRAGGHIRYLGSGDHGILGIVDCTECPPTFGADINDFRGFIAGGFDAMGVKDCSDQNPDVKISVHDFINLYESSDIESTKYDTIMVLLQSDEDPVLDYLVNRGLGDCLQKFRNERKGNGSVIAVFLHEFDGAKPTSITRISKMFDHVFALPMPSKQTVSSPHLHETADNIWYHSAVLSLWKWTLNTLSTCSHIIAGKVYENFMCDVRVRNKKLYYRAIRIIRNIVKGVSYDDAENALLQSIYKKSNVDGVKGHDINRHVQQATNMNKVVPRAIIMATLKCSVDMATDILQKQPIVREAIRSITSKTIPVDHIR